MKSRIRRNWSNHPISPSVAYDLIADGYNSWHWTSFWKRNEGPIVEKIISDLRPGIFLDLGCGTGRYRAWIEGHHLRYIGVDVSERMLIVNEHSHPDSSSLSLLKLADLRDTHLEANSVDAILMSRVLSHLGDINAVFSECARLLKPAGHLIITDIHPEHPYKTTVVSDGLIKIAIETYKWTFEDLRSACDLTSLQLLRFQDFAVSDLLSSPAERKFQKLFRNPTTKVFYLFVAQKHTNLQAASFPFNAD